MKLVWKHTDGLPQVAVSVWGVECKALAPVALMAGLITCAVCRKRPAVAILPVPGMDASEACCSECQQGHAIPWDLCVVQTACLGGFDLTPPLWRRIVVATCLLNNKTLAEFDRQVEQAIEAVTAAMQALTQQEEPDK